MLAFSTQVRGFKPGRSRRIFKVEKLLSTPSFGGEVKPSVPCRRFTTCKRTLECIVEVGISRQNYRSSFSPTHSSTFRCLELLRRDIWRQKWEQNTIWGEHNKPVGCSVSRAYARGREHERRRRKNCWNFVQKSCRFTACPHTSSLVDPTERFS